MTLPSIFKKLLLVREIKFEKGRFIFMGDIPGFMIPSPTIIMLLKDGFLEHIRDLQFGSKSSWIDYVLSNETLKLFVKGLYKAGYVQAKLFYCLLKKYHSNLLKDKIKLVSSLLPEFFSTLGYGTIKFEKLDIDSHIVINVAPSSLAEDIFKIFGPLRMPVDFYLAGLFVGIGEAIFNKNYIIIESKCLAKGDNVCRFHIFVKDRVSEKLGEIPSEYLYEIHEKKEDLLRWYNNIAKWNLEANKWVDKFVMAFSKHELGE